MPDCAQCGDEIIRIRRNFLERAYTRAVFQCPSCGHRLYFRRSFFRRVRRYCECPQCGTRNLSQLKSIDRVDRLNKNPLRLLLAIFRAPLYHCTFCRLQFWDLRKRAATGSR